jgi:cobalt-zinc-cadmium efflux system outer membrane protein
MCAVVYFLSGCGSIPKSGEPAAEAFARLGLQNAIVFRTVGDPIDTTAIRPDVLTLSDAVRRALATDPDVQAALSRARVAQADVDQAHLLPNPILSILFRFPERSGKPVVEADLGIELLSILQRPGRISAADSRLRAATAEAMITVLDLISETQESYSGVQALDAIALVLDDRRKLMAQLVKLAQDRLANGEGTRLDTTVLDTQRLELEVEIREKHLERRRERLTLARLTGQPSSEPDWKIDPWQLPDAVEKTEAAWVATALERRPEIEAQRWELSALGVDYQLAKFSPFEQTQIGGKGERDNNWSVGPSLSAPLPFFDWGQARRAKAKALEIEALHKLTRAQRRVIEEVRKAHVAFVDFRETAELARDQLMPAGERRLRDTEAAYRAGQTDITALILANEDLQASREKVIELERKASSSLYKLQRAVGGVRVTPAAETVTPIGTLVLPATKPALDRNTYDHLK